jgi:hypothetical protein
VHGALLTSIGLALATWIPRQSLAMAISLSAYVLIAIAWPIVYFCVANRPHPGDAGPALSPMFVAGALADFFTIRSIQFAGFLWGAIIWESLVAVASVGLLISTVRSFDRCLGRIPEGSSSIVPAFALRRRDSSAAIGEWEGG